MAFSKKTWLDRIAEYPTRRRLKKSDGTDEIVTVSREEGAISQEGDAFSAANMNDLEDRVANEFDALNIKLDGKQPASTAITTNNISDQSVKYATSAGSASAATKAYQDGNGANIASTYLKGTQNNSRFLNRPSVNVDGTIVPLVVSTPQGGGMYPITQLYVANNPERLIIKWYADGNIITSYIAISRA
jgi:hypothetical protein